MPEVCGRWDRSSPACLARSRAHSRPANFFFKMQQLLRWCDELRDVRRLGRPPAYRLAPRRAGSEADRVARRGPRAGALGEHAVPLVELLGHVELRRDARPRARARRLKVRVRERPQRVGRERLGAARERGGAGAAQELADGRERRGGAEVLEVGAAVPFGEAAAGAGPQGRGVEITREGGGGESRAGGEPRSRWRGGDSTRAGCRRGAHPARWARSRCLPRTEPSSSASSTRRICSRAGPSGSASASRRGRRRSAASSRSKGRLVAPSTSTRWPAEEAESSPSHCARNSLRSRRVASCSCAEPRRPRSESISSRKMTQGARRRATRKMAATCFSSSPYLR